MKRENPFGDTASRASAEAGERNWAEGLNEDLKIAGESLSQSLEDCPNFLNIPPDQLPALIEQAKLYLEEEKEPDKKIAQRARDILSTPEAAAAEMEIVED